MKIFLIHGDDNDKSYKRLNNFIAEAKKRNWELVYLDESPFSIAENIASASLFSGERFLIHRNFNRVPKKDLEFLSKNSDKYEGNIVFYSENEVPKTLSNKLPKKTKIEDFKLPVLLWKFLDSIYPGNSKNVNSLYTEITKDKPAEFIFGLIARLLRDLYWAKASPETLPYPSWRAGKLKSQANRFLTGSLDNLISGMAKIDIQSKTSNVSLENELNLMLVSI